MPDGARAALYLHLARDDAPSRRLLEVQHTAVRAAAQSLGWHIVAVYHDIGFNASHDHPGLRAMLTAARTGQFDIVLVVGVTRLAHTVPGLLAAFGPVVQPTRSGPANTQDDQLTSSVQPAPAQRPDLRDGPTPARRPQHAKPSRLRRLARRFVRSPKPRRNRQPAN